ncbi:MAG: hypothetical protein AB7O39_09705 [Flavobacteriaceae bacterium]
MSNQALKLINDVQPERRPLDREGIEALMESIRTTTVIHERIFRTLLEGDKQLSPDLADFLEEAGKKYLTMSKQVAKAYMQVTFID